MKQGLTRKFSSSIEAYPKSYPIYYVKHQVSRKGYQYIGFANLGAWWKKEKNNVIISKRIHSQSIAKTQTKIREVNLNYYDRM